MAKTNQSQTLDSAWTIAFNSQTYGVSSNGEHSYELILTAKGFIREIDKEDWLPIAKQILLNNSYVNDHRLAEEAATIFINKKLNTDGLRVTFGGDT